MSREEYLRTPDDHSQRGAESDGNQGKSYGLINKKDRWGDCQCLAAWFGTIVFVGQLINLPKFTIEFPISSSHQYFLFSCNPLSLPLSLNHCTCCVWVSAFVPLCRSSQEPPLKRLREGRDYSGSPHSSPKRSGTKDSKTTSQDRSYSNRQDPSERSSREGKKERGDDDRQLPREQSWLYPHLRVRMVDQRYRKGRYYNTKVLF